MDSHRLLTVGVLRPIDETWKLDNIQLESIVIIKMTPSLAVSDRRKMQCLGTRAETGCVYKSSDWRQRQWLDIQNCMTWIWDDVSRCSSLVAELQRRQVELGRSLLWWVVSNWVHLSIGVCRIQEEERPVESPTFGEEASRESNLSKTQKDPQNTKNLIGVI